MGPLASLIARELTLRLRNAAQLTTIIIFFVLVSSLFPLGVGAEQSFLAKLAPGIIWIAALLATLLATDTLFDDDWQDGTLDQLLLAPQSFTTMVLAKAAAHWLGCGLPLLIAAPLVGLQLGLAAESQGVLAASLALGTPLLSLIAAFGAALTLGLKRSSTLVALLALPLMAPVIVFGAGAVTAAVNGLSAMPHLSLLAAFLILALLAMPALTAAALRVAAEQ